MEYDIDFVNTDCPTVHFPEAHDEIRKQRELIEEKYIAKFEEKFAEKLRGCNKEDVGALLVYTRANKVCAVFDYEFYAGWVIF